MWILLACAELATDAIVVACLAWREGFFTPPPRGFTFLNLRDVPPPSKGTHEWED